MNEIQKVSLVVGLGNPGRQYTDTRHNAGRRFVERLAETFEFSLQPQSRFRADFGEFRLDQRVVRILAPTTFMNHSGRSVAPCAAYFKIAPDQILVVHDELDLEPGNCRLKFGGGHGGHNGLADIKKSLGTPDFIRLRIGIGHPGSAKRVTGYVLSRPDASDSALINKSMDKAMQVMQRVFAGQLEQAMHQLHTKDLTHSEPV